MDEVRVCGCEHSSVGTAVASPDAELEHGSCSAAGGPLGCCRGETAVDLAGASGVCDWMVCAARATKPPPGQNTASARRSCRRQNQQDGKDHFRHDTEAAPEGTRYCCRLYGRPHISAVVQ